MCIRSSTRIRPLNCQCALSPASEFYQRSYTEVYDLWFYSHITRKSHHYTYGINTHSRTGKSLSLLQKSIENPKFHRQKCRIGTFPSARELSPVLRVLSTRRVAEKALKIEKYAVFLRDILIIASRECDDIKGRMSVRSLMVSTKAKKKNKIYVPPRQLPL